MSRMSRCSLPIPYHLDFLDLLDYLGLNDTFHYQNRSTSRLRLE